MDRETRKRLIPLAEDSIVENHTWQRGPYTHVMITVNPYNDLQGYVVEGHGFSKCRPGDVWSGAEGIAKAWRRAILDAAQQLNLLGV